jgi:hypothetical protein
MDKMSLFSNILHLKTNNIEWDYVTAKACYLVDFVYKITGFCKSIFIRLIAFSVILSILE